jgi:hypothetical protein
MQYDPETAPVGELEIGILVFILSLASNLINQKVNYFHFLFIVQINDK